MSWTAEEFIDRGGIMRFPPLTKERIQSAPPDPEKVEVRIPGLDLTDEEIQALKIDERDDERFDADFDGTRK